MRVLIACEESQRVCTEFRRLGHEAYSCDIQEPSGGHPEWHILGDCLPLLNGNCEFETMDGATHRIDGKWDLLIAHPPCTDLASSGAAWFSQKQKDFRQQRSCIFFMRFILANADRIAVENPIGIMSTCYRKPDQIIQPWMFGDLVQKSTCLWLKNLPLLKPEHTEKPQFEYFEWTDKKTGRVKRQTRWCYNTRKLPLLERGKAASKTFPGIARAMAEQWGGDANV